MNRTQFWWSAGALAEIVVVAVLRFLPGKDDAEATPVGQVQRTVQVTRGDLDLTVSANGVVQPINRVELRSKAGGIITELRFVEGQAVEKGELLISVDRTIALNDYEQARADIELARASVAQQENSVNRARELFAKGLMSQQELDQANVDYIRAKSTLVKAKASLASAEERLRETRIMAPIAGPRPARSSRSCS